MSIVSLIDNDDVAKKWPLFYTAKNLHPLMVKYLKKDENYFTVCPKVPECKFLVLFFSNLFLLRGPDVFELF